MDKGLRERAGADELSNSHSRATLRLSIRCSRQLVFATKLGMSVPDDGSESHHIIQIAPPTMRAQ